MSPMSTGVYCIRNTVNGKRYVGSAAKSLADRFKMHRFQLGGGYHFNKHLQAAWQKYGEANFEFSVLEYCPPEMCVEREQYWIDFYQTAKQSTGYNVCPVAGSRLGTQHSEVTKSTWSRKRKGKRRSQEATAKATASNKGKKRSAEFCARMSQIAKEREAKMKRKQTEETKAKIAEASRRRWQDEEYKRLVSQKISESLTGKTLTDEHRANLVASHSTDEYRAKASARMKGNKNGQRCQVAKDKRLPSSQLVQEQSSQCGDTSHEE